MRRLAFIVLVAMLTIGSGHAVARDCNASVQKREIPTEWPIGLQIVSPSAGTIVHAGSRVEVCVESLPGFMPVRVLIGVRTSAEWVMDAPYSTTLLIPTGELGASELWAIGIDAEGNRFVAEPLDIDVDTTAVMTSIVCEPDKFFFTKYLFAYQISVSGMYNDGVSRDASSASRGTTYSSDDTSIATVNAIGELRSVGVGKTVIRAHNGALESTTKVSVVGMPLLGDFDGDDVVDTSDLRQMLLHMGECLGCPGDLNGDGVIDRTDVELHFPCWTD